MLDGKDLDAVVIATPDHWHALPTIEAVLAGKDVYVEKPIGHNVAEGQAMIRACRKTGKIMAVGTQQRSPPHFQKAVEIVRSGQLGKVFWVQTWNFENISPVGMGRPSDTDAPANVDYDRWLGPAPARPFNPNRYHLLFRWFFDYAGGMMSDWGVHLNDIVLWALDAKAPRVGQRLGRHLHHGRQPRHARHPAGRLRLPRLHPDVLDAQGERAAPERARLRHPLLRDRRQPASSTAAGTRSRPTRSCSPTASSSPRATARSARSTSRPRRSRGATARRPTSTTSSSAWRAARSRSADIEIGHHSTNTCHLGNIAYKLGRKLDWDEATETFKDDREANALLTREPRRGFELPKI